MKVLNKEEREFTRKTASFTVYYDCIKDSFLKSDWAKVKNKYAICTALYYNGLTVFEGFKQIRQIIK